MNIFKTISKKLKSYKLRSHQGGYLLLFAVVLSSIVLAVGLGIVNIVNKGLILASSGRSSQFAFYAADTGAECALYWDREHTGFTNTVFATSSASSVPGSGASCIGEDIATTWTVSGVTAVAADTTFDLTLGNGTCTSVKVSKTSSGLITIIDSRGYNTCDTTNPRRIERAVRVKY